MHLLRFYHSHRLHKLARHPDWHMFELAVWLHMMALSLVSIFVPILLLKIGYSITQVLVYYLVFNVLDVPLNFLVRDLMRKIGARNVLIAATLTVIAFFVLLGFLPANNWPLLMLLAFLAAAYDALFWVAHIYLFIEISRDGMDTGETSGTLEGIRRFGSVIGPIMGAFVLTESGRLPLVVTSVILFALSIVPLFKLRSVRDVSVQKKKSFKDFFSTVEERRDYLSIALFGIHNEVDSVLWALFIFMFFQTFESVAAVPVIVALTTAIFSYFTGKLTKRYETTMITLGSILIACTWIIRILFHIPTLYYVSVFLVGFFTLLVSVPLDGNIAARALKRGSLDAATYRNAASMALHIPLYLILLLLVAVFKVSFAVAALSLFLLLLVTLFFKSERTVSPAIAQEVAAEEVIAKGAI